MVESRGRSSKVLTEIVLNLYILFALWELINSNIQFFYPYV